LLQKAVAAREEEKKKRRRAMDTLYARRKNESRKIETEVTEDQVKRLTEQNTNLRKRNEILQDLMQQALQLVAGFQEDRKPAAQTIAGSMVLGSQDDRKIPAEISVPSSKHFSYSATETSRVSSLATISFTARLQQQSHQQDQHHSASLDTLQDTKPSARQRPLYPQSSIASMFSGPAKSASNLQVLPQELSAGRDQSAIEILHRDRNVAKSLQLIMRDELRSRGDLLYQGEAHRQNELLQQRKRQEVDLERQDQAFREGERREENFQRQNDILREEEFRLYSNSARQRERDYMQRQANQNFQGGITHESMLVRDGEVRHQNQLTRERELQRENQVLRDSIAASARRAKNPNGTHHQEASEQVDQRRAAQQGLQQQHQREQQSLQQQQHIHHLNLQWQQQGQQQQQEKQQQKEQDQLQQRQQQHQ
jgi:hypothetical protein